MFAGVTGEVVTPHCFLSSAELNVRRETMCNLPHPNEEMPKA